MLLNLEEIQEMTALVVSAINNLYQRGNHGHKIPLPFSMAEDQTIPFSAAIAAIVRVSEDMETMDLTKDEKEDLSVALGLANYLFVTNEQMRIVGQTILNMKTIAHKLVDKINQSQPEENA